MYVEEEKKRGRREEEEEERERECLVFQADMAGPFPLLSQSLPRRHGGKNNIGYNDFYQHPDQFKICSLSCSLLSRPPS